MLKNAQKMLQKRIEISFKDASPQTLSSSLISMAPPSKLKIRISPSELPAASSASRRLKDKR